VLWGVPPLRKKGGVGYLWKEGYEVPCVVDRTKATQAGIGIKGVIPLLRRGAISKGGRGKGLMVNSRLPWVISPHQFGGYALS